MTGEKTPYLIQILWPQETDQNNHALASTHTAHQGYQGRGPLLRLGAALLKRKTAHFSQGDQLGLQELVIKFSGILHAVVNGICYII